MVKWSNTDLWLNFEKVFGRFQTRRRLLRKLNFLHVFHKYLIQESFTASVTQFLGYYAVNACILLPLLTDFNSQSVQSQQNLRMILAVYIFT